MKSPTMVCVAILCFAVTNVEALDSRFLPARAPVPSVTSGASPLPAQAPVDAAGRILRVGPSGEYATPSAAAAAARDGDTI